MPTAPSSRPAPRRRARNLLGRATTVGLAAGLSFSVLASTVTAAPSIPGWLLLPLEASGMVSAHPATAADSPEPTKNTVPFDVFVAQQASEEVLAGGADLAAADEGLAK